MNLFILLNYMINHKIYKPKEINFNDIVYENIKGSENRKCSFIKYQSKNRLLFQTCELYNINLPVKKEYYYELDIPLRGKSYEKVNELVNFFGKLDEKIISIGKQNINNWFNNNDIKYKSIIRYNTEEECNFIKIKITPSTKIIYNNNIIKPNQIKKDTSLRMILECYAIWITDIGFGIYLKPLLIEQNDLEKINLEFRPESPDENDILDTEIEDISIIVSSNKNVLESNFDREYADEYGNNTIINTFSSEKIDDSPKINLEITNS